MSVNLHVIEANSLEEALAQIAEITKSKAAKEEVQKREQENAKKLAETRPTAHATVTRFLSRETEMPTRAQIEVEYLNMPSGFGVKRRRAEILAKDYPSLDAFIDAISKEATDMQVIPGVEVVGLTAITELEK